MKIYYPTYYLVPVEPVIFLDDEDYKEDIGFRYGMDVDQAQNSYRNIDEDIFALIDEEYVIESTK
ncbi:hypothetical protein [Clostridium sp.]|jgi:hypothetical protein|uniref:hypothetical protein n=1 Tax=Clostridium sp. TaxID=1506 RepID=UPI003EEE3E2C